MASCDGVGWTRACKNARTRGVGEKRASPARTRAPHRQHTDEGKDSVGVPPRARHAHVHGQTTDEDDDAHVLGDWHVFLGVQRRHPPTHSSIIHPIMHPWWKEAACVLPTPTNTHTYTGRQASKQGHAHQNADGDGACQVRCVCVRLQAREGGRGRKGRKEEAGPLQPQPHPHPPIHPPTARKDAHVLGKIERGGLLRLHGALVPLPAHGLQVRSVCGDALCLHPSTHPTHPPSQYTARTATGTTARSSS